MSTVTPGLADIDAALAKGEWWLRILEELAEAGVALAGELAADVKAGRKDPRKAADEYVRIAAAVREAAAMSFRLEEALRGLASLRARTLEEIAAAKAAAAAQAAAEAAARAKACAKDKERREARKAKVRELVMEAIDREAADVEDRETLSLVLEQRLSFDPAFADIESLPLRETVERICADLGITPDWSRWEAEDWNPPAPIFHGPWPPPRPDDPPKDLAADTASPIRPPAPARLE
jgi:hypothetical protein